MEEQYSYNSLEPPRVGHQLDHALLWDAIPFFNQHLLQVSFSTTSTLSHYISDVAANSSLIPVPSPLSAKETRVRLELQ